MPYRNCTAADCNVYQQPGCGISFFRFPRDLERCKIWLINSGRQDLERTLQKGNTDWLSTNCALCAAHFEDSQFMNSDSRNRLIWSAVPTLFSELSHPKLFGRKRNLPADAVYIVTKKPANFQNIKKMSSTLTSGIMRAVYVRKFGGACELKVENNVPIPSVGEKQVLIKIYSSGINPVDTYIREGEFLNLPKLPYIPGVDGAGVVESIGSLVLNFEVGDRVFLSQNQRYGTLAEFVVADETNVFALSGLTFNEGAGIGIPYFTAYRALFQKANAKEGERVLVHGASGSVGIAAVQIAKANGLIVVGTAGTADGLKLVRSNGADAVFNHREPKYLQKLAKDGPFDVILEMLSNENLGHDLELMNSRGRTVIVGCRGEVTINPRLMMGLETSVIGVALFSSTPEEWRELTTKVTAGVREGWVCPAVNQVYELHQAAQAHEDIINSTGAKGKLVVKILD